MYFIGIDPSTKCTGYCVMDIDYNILEKGKIVTPTDESECGKIAFQAKEFERILTKYPPERVMCEDQFFRRNIDTLKKLSRTTGAFMNSSSRLDHELELVYPAGWRKVFHGSGSASKKDTFEKVIAIYELEGLVFSRDNDMTDAIGIAWACVDLYKESAVA